MAESASTPAVVPPVRLLMVVPDVVGEKMAGPGMRYVALAKALAPFLPVTLAVAESGSTALDFGTLNVTVRTWHDHKDLQKLVDECDIVFCQFFDTNVVRYALRAGKRVVYDLYNALPIETIGAERISGHTDAEGKDREYAELLRYFRFASKAGSYFVTSNERQRDWWLGYIMASDGIRPSTLGGRGPDDIVGLAPFGMTESDPVQQRSALRGHHGITDDDFVLIWAGGIWDWFDALTPIRAVAELAGTDSRIKLVFYGTVHPNATIGKPPAVDRAEELARSLGVLGTSVIFLHDWVPAEERADYLLDADAALSAHKQSLETHYAFRTRVLDHFWAKLPSIVSSGDWFADYIEKEQLGLATPPGDVEAMKAAISRLSTDVDLRERVVGNIERVREDWRWSATTRELREHLTVKVDTLAFRPEPADTEQDSQAQLGTGALSGWALARGLIGRVGHRLRLGRLARLLRPTKR
ncbi:glycosyltransferase involved in cell wall biosynthesis [Conyzicola nivalis]|uniref:Glycosyltransferase involved in cell wall biosynthesis n=1 Tax=Conyzicola nivalis TaxID=1477021 RepID=A0ABV2QR64_9MICO